MICWVRSASVVERVGVQRLGAAENGGHGLQRGAHHVVVRLLRGERYAGRLGVESQLPRTRILRPEPVAHYTRPQPPGGAELRQFLEEVAVRVEEERDPRRKGVHVHAGVDAVLDVLDAVAEGERQFLRRGRTGLADVIPADRDGVPLRHLAHAEREDVGDEPHRRPRRVDELLLGDELFEDVVLDRP
jgi:hypothetical protein